MSLDKEAHMWTRNLMLASAVLVTCSCVTVTLAPGAEKVKLTHDPSDVAGCKVAGNVSGVWGSGEYERVSEALLRNRAVGLDGNTVLVTLSEDGPLQPAADREGVAYRCP
jgi:hypothetical protein